MEKRGRRAACCWLFAGGTIALFAALATYVLRPEPGLLDGAARLANAGTWVHGFGSYFWETDRSVLTFRPSGAGVRAVSVQTGSGAETERTKLSMDLVNAGAGVREWRLSRGGRYLLGAARSAADRILRDLSGTRLKSGPVTPAAMRRCGCRRRRLAGELTNPPRPPAP